MAHSHKNIFGKSVILMKQMERILSVNDLIEMSIQFICH